jgi:hypothetical protein
MINRSALTIRLEVIALRSSRSRYFRFARGFFARGFGIETHFHRGGTAGNAHHSRRILCAIRLFSGSRRFQRSARAMNVEG